MALVNLVIVMALLQFFAFGAAVGKARGTYRVAAPATTGHEMFERYYRVQMNTLELLVILLPALWLFAYYLSPATAAGLGVLYLIGRLVYFVSYVKDPKTRSLGFALSSGPILLLMLGALYGAARVAWHAY
ncbi:MAG: MAPEG family protein [Steroidobacteraceae bacterium]